jgi:hypothetical protein
MLPPAVGLTAGDQSGSVGYPMANTGGGGFHRYFEMIPRKSANSRIAA